MESRFSNVHCFADADFDMDIDANFHESERLFFDKLGYVKKDEDAEEEEEEETNTDGQKSDSADAKAAQEESKEAKPQKPVKFLERPAAVRKAQNEYLQNYSDDSDDEDKILDTLLKDETTAKEPAKTEEAPAT